MLSKKSLYSFLFSLSKLSLSLEHEPLGTHKIYIKQIHKEHFFHVRIRPYNWTIFQWRWIVFVPYFFLLLNKKIWVVLLAFWANRWLFSLGYKIQGYKLQTEFLVIKGKRFRMKLPPVKSTPKSYKSNNNKTGRRRKTGVAKSIPGMR